MAERKGGPVKPPILDLEAKKGEADTGKSAESKSPAAKGATGGTAHGAKSASDSKSDTGSKKPGSSGGASTGAASKSPDRAASKTPGDSRLAPALAGLAGGAVLGVALSYGVALMGFWPTPSAGPNPEIATLKTELAALEKTASANASEVSGLGGRIDALRSSTGGEVSKLTNSVADLSKKVDAAQTVDLGPIEKRIAALSDRINAVAAGASSSDAEALSKGLSDNRTQIATLTDKLSGLQATLAGLTSDVGDLKARVGAIENRPPPDANAAAAAAVRLPMALSGLQGAFDTGKPYASELAAVTKSLPSITVPAPVADAQQTGLPRPDLLASQLHQAIPRMLSAKPVPKGTNWQGVVLDRIKSLLAMRPSSEATGDSPEALVSRIEAAVSRRDFATARTLIGKLPAPMAAAAGDLPQQIGALADAYGLIEAARATALEGAQGGAQ